MPAIVSARRSPMRRREFVAGLGAAATFLPSGIHAQQADTIRRIGFLGAPSAAKYARLIDAFRQGLHDLGYVEGKNITIDFRWAEGNDVRLPALAAELIDLKPDVLVTHGTPGTRAAEQSTRTLPIVMAVSGDAVATGLVNSLAQPGGNVTGTTFFGPELAAKRLELLREAIPAIHQVAVLVNPANPVDGPVLASMAKTATSLNITLQQFMVRRSDELEDTFARIATQKLDGVAVFEDAITVANAPKIAQLAARWHLASTGFADIARDGGLIGYGANIPALFRRAGYFVDKILHGARPADIPVEQPTKFDMVINVRTAKLLGHEIAPTLIATADEVVD